MFSRATGDTRHYVVVCLALFFTLSGTAVAADSTDSETPTFREFVAQTYQMEDGTWIVNGDEPVINEGELKDFYDRVYGEDRGGGGGGGNDPSTYLVVNTVQGVDDRWRADVASNLTYCVSKRFGADATRVAAAVAQGASLWEGASSGVNYVYLPGESASCNTRNPRVVFSVEPTKDPGVYARAFFPSYPKRKRNVVVNTSATFNGDYRPENILGHELGHTLGFRHEHIRPEAGTCFEDTSWRALTPYDENSIMHYPWCNGGVGALTWSSYDAQGTAALYGT